jgi:3-hydroxyisobutyrate dehydrogenase
MSGSSLLHLSRRTLFTASTAPRASIGFIGLGNMGAPMAANLLKRQHQVTVLDVNPLAVKQLAALGAKAAPTPAALASSGVDVVVTMLPSSPHARAVYTGESGVLSGVKAGTLLVDASTIDPTVSRELALAAAQKGAAFIDAPVSGGVGGATNGTLTFMVGGARDAFDKAKPILECMGKNVVYCGGPGNGQVVKICNNLVLGISMIGVSEAMNLGIKLGMDPKTLAGIFNTSSARCWASDTYNPVPGVIDSVPASRNYDGGFGSALMAKDLGLAVAAAHDIKAPLPLGGAALQVYNLLAAHGLANKDFSVAYQFLAAANVNNNNNNSSNSNEKK